MRMMLRTHIDATDGSDALKSGALQKAISAFSRSSSRRQHISASKAASEPPFSSSTWKTLTNAPRSPRRFSTPAAMFICRRA
jgi:hypothetical protein